MKNSWAGMYPPEYVNEMEKEVCQHTYMGKPRICSKCGYHQMEEYKQKRLELIDRCKVVCDFCSKRDAPWHSDRWSGSHVGTNAALQICNSIALQIRDLDAIYRDKV